jgi:hypothetical protein
LLYANNIDYVALLKKKYVSGSDRGVARNIGQGEAQHRKYKTLKFGGGQAYDLSIV